MKHTSYIILLASLFAVSCVNEGDTLQPSGAADGIGFVGTMNSGDDSRTSYEQTDESVKVAWTTSDRIGIFSEVGGSVKDSNFGYQAAEAAATTSFHYLSGSEVVEWADETTPHDFYAYYPYDETVTDMHAVPVCVASEQPYDGSDPMGFLSACDFMYASSLGHTKAEVGEGNTLPFAFRHLFSILRVRIRASQFVGVDAVKFRCTDEAEAVSLDSGATVDLATGEIDMTSATTTNEIAVVGHRELTMNDYADYYMLVTPGHAGKTFEFVAVIGDTERVFATRTVGENGLSVGKTIIVEADLEVSDEEASPVTDLSAAGTANTYYVSQPGTIYRFKATVKGNGEAYTSAGLTYTAEELAIEPKGVLVLWYNSLQTSYTPWVKASPIALGSLTIGGDGYVYFQTPNEFVNGNAVIVVLDTALGYDDVEVDANRFITNANVLWSWNIVASEGYDIEASAFSKGGYTFMNRDLGAVIDPEQALIDGKYNGIALASTVGNYYQYGRKDPFPSIPDYTSAIADYMTGLLFTPTYTSVAVLDQGTFGKYDRFADNQIFGTGISSISCDLAVKLGDGYSMADALAHAATSPHVWVRCASNNWLDAAYGNTVWSSDDTFAAKTIYDPCPAGWRVMTRNAWTALIEDGSATARADVDTARGLRLDGEYYFPINSKRNGTNASVEGYIGSCSANCESVYVVPGFDSGCTYAHYGKFVTEYNYAGGGEGADVISFNQGNTYSTSAFCVRCVKIP